MSSGKGGYSAGKTVKKGLLHGALSLLPAVAGLVAVALQVPEVAYALERAWPAGPVAVLIGAAVGLLNWSKNRGK